MTARPTNPEKDQDRAADLCDLWQRYGFVMFRQQRAIYERLALRCAWKGVIEAGCGDGVGSALLERRAAKFLATDKLDCNVRFARELYPWIRFEQWDLNRPWRGEKYEYAVCVEAIEHVADPERALAHLVTAATAEVWFSTPNGRVKREHPPSNPWHVAEYTPTEVLGMVAGLGRSAEVLDWETFEPVSVDTEVNPLVYRVRL